MPPLYKSKQVKSSQVKSRHAPLDTCHLVIVRRSRTETCPPCSCTCNGMSHVMSHAPPSCSCLDHAMLGHVIPVDRGMPFSWTEECRFRGQRKCRFRGQRNAVPCQTRTGCVVLFQCCFNAVSMPFQCHSSGQSGLAGFCAAFKTRYHMLPWDAVLTRGSLGCGLDKRFLGMRS